MSNEISKSLEQARELHRQGNFDLACSKYASLITHYLKSPIFWSWYGAAKLSSGNNEKAIQILTKSLELKRTKEVTNNLGTAYWRSGLLDNAERSFYESLEIDNEFEPARRNLFLLSVDRKVEGGFSEKLNQIFPRDYANVETFVWAAEELTRGRDTEFGLTLIDRAILIQPDNVDLLIKRAVLLANLRYLKSALKVLEAAGRLSPRDSRVKLNQGNVLKAMGHLVESERLYREAISLNPEFAEAYTNLGLVLKDQGQLESALSMHEKAITLSPSLAIAYLNKGVTLRLLKRNNEAIEAYQSAIRFDNSIVEAHSNLGAALKDSRRYEEAERALKTAISLNASYVEAYNNLGIVYRETDRRDAAIKVLRKSVQLNPRFFQAWANLGNVFKDCGDVEKALESYDQAIAIKEDLAEAYWGKALAYLLRGDLIEGFQLYDWRWKTQEFQEIKGLGHIATWQGESLRGRSIVVHAEQGLGDTIQFSRFLLGLKTLGAEVTMLCQRRLAPIFSASFPDIAVVFDLPKEPIFDFKIAVMSLAARLQIHTNKLPYQKRYIRPADTTSIDMRWLERLDPKKLTIGIAWQGNRESTLDRNRSIPLAHFKPLVEKLSSNLVILQRGEGLEQLSDCSFRESVIELPDELDREGAFLDTSYIIEKHLDLVVTSDTSIAHLVGALGKPVFVALQSVPEWRWGLYGTKSPWYPSMRLFRQSRDGDWESVFNEIAHYLSLNPIPQAAVS